MSGTGSGDRGVKETAIVKAKQPARGWLSIFLPKKPTPEELGQELIIAAHGGNTRQCLALIDQGAKLEEKNDNGNTALILAASGNFINIVALLLDRGVKNINEKNNNNRTALLIAAYYGRTEIVRLLLSHGANPTIGEDEDGDTLSNARKDRNTETICLIEEALLQRSTGWNLIDATRISHTEYLAPLRYKITEIFNFAAHERLVTTTDMSIKTASSIITRFHDIDRHVLENALKEFTALGGKIDAHAALDNIIYKQILPKKIS